MKPNRLSGFSFLASKNKKWKLLLYFLPIYIILLLHYCPSILLHHNFRYKNFTIHSSEPVDPAIRKILDNSLKRLQRSEINNPNSQHHLYLCEGFSYAKFFGLSLFRAFAWNNSLDKIFIVKTDAKNDLCYRNDTQHSSVSLSETISHEVIHSFQRDELGWLGMIVMPTWKIEGYAMYASKYDSFNLNKAKKEILALRDQFSFPANYGRYDIATLYLFDKKHYTFTQFNETEQTLEDILYEIEKR